MPIQTSCNAANTTYVNAGRRGGWTTLYILTTGDIDRRSLAGYGYIIVQKQFCLTWAAFSFLIIAYDIQLNCQEYSCKSVEFSDRCQGFGACFGHVTAKGTCLVMAALEESYCFQLTSERCPCLDEVKELLEKW